MAASLATNLSAFPAAFLLAVLTLAAGVWLVDSGLAKRRHWLDWWRALGNYRLLPDALRSPVAHRLPMIEIVLGSALWVPGIDRLALLLCVLLFAGFTLAIGANLAFGLTRFDCGCQFGRRSPHAAWLLLRALMLIVAAAAMLALPAPDLISRLAAAAVVATGSFAVFAVRALARNRVLAESSRRSNVDPHFSH